MSQDMLSHIQMYAFTMDAHSVNHARDWVKGEISSMIKVIKDCDDADIDASDLNVLLEGLENALESLPVYRVGDRVIVTTDAGRFKGVVREYRITPTSHTLRYVVIGPRIETRTSKWCLEHDTETGGVDDAK